MLPSGVRGQIILREACLPQVFARAGKRSAHAFAVGADHVLACKIVQLDVFHAREPMPFGEEHARPRLGKGHEVHVLQLLYLGVHGDDGHQCFST